jgi:hypothetical protein
MNEDNDFVAGENEPFQLATAFSPGVAPLRMFAVTSICGSKALMAAGISFRLIGDATGILPGDLLRSIEARPIRSEDDLGEILGSSSQFRNHLKSIGHDLLLAEKGSIFPSSTYQLRGLSRTSKRLSTEFDSDFGLCRERSVPPQCVARDHPVLSFRTGW